MAQRVKDHRRELLRTVMIKADMNPEEFADVIARDRVTVYRWLAGTRPVPNVVEKWLLRMAPSIIGNRGAGDT
jgi:hypothetical protein